MRPRPWKFQIENWQCDPLEDVRPIGRLPVAALDRLLDAEEPLWVDGYSSKRGWDDRVPLDRAEECLGSLRFLRVRKLVLVRDGPEHAKPRIRAQFRRAGVHYRLRVTDLRYDDLAGPREELGECYLTVSLGESWDDCFCYKLVAAIVPRNEG